MDNGGGAAARPRESGTGRSTTQSTGQSTGQSTAMMSTVKTSVEFAGIELWAWSP